MTLATIFNNGKKKERKKIKNLPFASYNSSILLDMEIY